VASCFAWANGDGFSRLSSAVNQKIRTPITIFFVQAILDEIFSFFGGESGAGL
jgi:hypothetical protein